MANKISRAYAYKRNLTSLLWYGVTNITLYNINYVIFKVGIIIGLNSITIPDFVTFSGDGSTYLAFYWVTWVCTYRRPLSVVWRFVINTASTTSQNLLGNLNQSLAVSAGESDEKLQTRGVIMIGQNCNEASIFRSI